MDSLITSGAVLEVLSVLIIVALFVWRMPSKEDSQRLDAKVEALRQDMKAGFQHIDERFERQDAKFEARFEAQDAKFETRFQQQDVKFETRFQQQGTKLENMRSEMNAGFQRVDERFEAQRIEFKADLQRVEDRAAEANVFHARSVELLDAIRRELEDRRERL